MSPLKKFGHTIGLIVGFNLDRESFSSGDIHIRYKCKGQDYDPVFIIAH